MDASRYSQQCSKRLASFCLRVPAADLWHKVGQSPLQWPELEKGLNDTCVLCRDADAALRKPARAYGTSRSAEEQYTPRQYVEEEARIKSLDSHEYVLPTDRDNLCHDTFHNSLTDMYSQIL